MRSNDTQALVIVPTFNERENIETVVDGLMEIAGISVLIVDDGSPDGTGEIADRLTVANPGRVHVLHRAEKQGLGSAYMDGFRFGLDRGFGYMFEMDADGSHDPIDVPRLLEEARNGHDVVIGSRRIKGGKVVGWGPHRHLMSFGAMTLARMSLGLKTKDVTAGFRCYRAHVVSTLCGAGIDSNGYAFQEETIYLCERRGYRIKEIPIIFRDRERGVSKLSGKDIVEFFSTIFRLRRR